eukprot:7034398-Karenia_brevis.AAC.1
MALPIVLPGVLRTSATKDAGPLRPLEPPVSAPSPKHSFEKTNGIVLSKTGQPTKELKKVNTPKILPWEVQSKPTGDA